MCEGLIIFIFLLLNDTLQITAMKQSGVEATKIVKTPKKQTPTSSGIVLEGTSCMRKSCLRVQLRTALIRLLCNKRKPGFPNAQNGELSTDWSATGDCPFFGSELARKEKKKKFGGIQSAIDFICSPGQVAPDRGRHKSVDLSEGAQDGPLLSGRQHEWVWHVSIVKSKIIYSISPLAAVLLWTAVLVMLMSLFF